MAPLAVAGTSRSCRSEMKRSIFMVKVIGISDKSIEKELLIYPKMYVSEFQFWFIRCKNKQRCTSVNFNYDVFVAKTNKISIKILMGSVKKIFPKRRTISRCINHPFPSSLQVIKYLILMSKLFCRVLN